MKKNLKILKDRIKNVSLCEGRFKVLDYNSEKHIYEWVAFNRSLVNVFVTWLLGLELIKKYPVKINIKIHSLLNAVYRFMKCFNLTIRKGSHIGKQLPSDSDDKILKVLTKIILLRKEKNIIPENIINIDETSFTYSMHSNVTLHKIGAKTIMIKTQKQEKLRISVIMSI